MTNRCLFHNIKIKNKKIVNTELLFDEEILMLVLIDKDLNKV